MSGDQEFNRRYHQRVEAEVAEASEPRNRRQAEIDRWWQAQRELDAELADQYFVGGFQEFHSKTPSFHKSRWDKDWRTR